MSFWSATLYNNKATDSYLIMRGGHSPDLKIWTTFACGFSGVDMPYLFLLDSASFSLRGLNGFIDVIFELNNVLPESFYIRFILDVP